MKKQLLVIVLGCSIMWTNSVLSYYREGVKPANTNSGQNKASGCAPAIGKMFMEFNDVRALIETGGSMWEDRANTMASYEVPKVEGNGTHHYAIFAGSLWMGGKTASGQLKLAALTFRTGNDFWTGPLTVIPGTGNFQFGEAQGLDMVKESGPATITPDDCLAYDHFYTIRKAEVATFLTWWECDKGISDPLTCATVLEAGVSDDVMLRIINWPAHPITASLNQDRYLAPFYDNSYENTEHIKNGFYNPLEDGDYPWYDGILGRKTEIACHADRRVSLFGDETHWWIFNDNGNIHTESGGMPIGMEIRAQAFCFATSDDVNRMTFYNYELINRGTTTLYDTYFAQYVDSDLGGAKDDYVGCDISRGLGYCYNGDGNDLTDAGQTGYGLNPPAIGVDFFEGPYKDPDSIDNGLYKSSLGLDSAITDGGIVYDGIGIGYGDQIIDNERLGMTRFSYYTNGASAGMGDPSTASEFYYFMEGKWGNGVQMTYGGTGNGGTIPSTYMFPGDSDPLGWATNGAEINGDWSEVTENNPANDRRFVLSAGSFTLLPGAVNNITVGVIYGRGMEADLFSSVRALKNADSKAQALFDACFVILDPPMAPQLKIQELENELILMLDNPGQNHNNYKEGYNVEDQVNIPNDMGYDRFYKFEGYQIFQLKDASTSVTDIRDENKAQLVAQCDKVNGISKLINWENEEITGFDKPVLKVDGTNSGIKHSFQITEDMFAQGDRALVNHKKYYYVAVAYAYNNFKEFNPKDPLLLDGQKMRYISSRLGFDGNSILAVEGIPHNPMPEADGTNQYIGYGSTPRITRLDGYGNGGRELELTAESENTILQNGFMETPTYEQNGGPINVKVVDPLNLADGYFECLFDDKGWVANNNGCDSAQWTVNHYTDATKSTLIDSQTGVVNISQDNEQIIPQWGVSIQIAQILNTQSSDKEFCEPLSSSIDFADSTKKWLSGVPDNAGFDPSNWIRSGTSSEADVPTSSPAYLNPLCYKDEADVDDEKKYTKLLGGTIAPHRLTGFQCDYQPLAYYGVANNGAPSSGRNLARVSYLPSVDIVITTDKSKWTRCPVFELGRDVNLTVGGAKQGEIRKSNSVDKDGKAETGTGMGWFPGYAIDLESGARLYMAFGENSFLSNDGGADMIWNPSQRAMDNQGNPIMGGLQPIYIFSYKQATMNGNTGHYDFPAYNETTNPVYDMMQLIQANDPTASTLKRQLYCSLSWVANTIGVPGQDVLASDCRIKLRVTKEYKRFSATGQNAGLPMYSWNMDELGTKVGDRDRLVDALKMINVVPNPYYAYSEYEGSRYDTRVKVTNLPEKCTVTIYSVNGKLIRQYKKDSEITSLDWDLNNHVGIPVASGVYLIHVDVPGVGERVLKFFGGMRQVDLNGI